MCVCITYLKYNCTPRSKFYPLYAVPSGKEVIEFQCILPWESFSNFRNIMQTCMCQFASTYICEPAFSAMKGIKNKNRSWLENGNLQNLLILATTNLTQDINSFAANKQNQNLDMKRWEFLSVNLTFCVHIFIRKVSYYFVDVRCFSSNSVTVVGIKICQNY